MCGRYYVDRELPADILRIVMNTLNAHVDIAEHDVHPSELAPVITHRKDVPELEAIRWGMTSEKNSGLVINAKAETILDRSLFTESALSRRCVIPARHFYEWDRSSNKCICSLPEHRTMYMAGIYKRCSGEERFAIITTAANSSMRTIHDRMPLLLNESEVLPWLKNSSDMFGLLKKLPDNLDIHKDFEQLSFDFT